MGGSVGYSLLGLVNRGAALIDGTIAPVAAWGLLAIGSALLDSYILPFEIIGLLLFTALVGAVLIARKEPNS